MFVRSIAATHNFTFIFLNFLFPPKPLSNIGYDIANFFCLIPVSYFGGRVGASKPKWVGWGIIVMGLGFLTFSLPHFLVGPYRAQLPDDNYLCSATRENGTSADDECSTDANSPNAAGIEDLSWNVWFFFVAQLLHGIGEKRK